MSYLCRWTMDRLYLGNSLVDCWPIFREAETTDTVTSSMVGGKNSIAKVYSPSGSLNMFKPSRDEYLF